MRYPKQLENLIESLRQLPSVGPKMATRMALSLYKNSGDVVGLIDSLSKISTLASCSKCFAIAESDVCNICNDTSRDNNKIMIVEDYLDMVNIENSGEYNGLYNILGGVISPMNNIMPEDLQIGKILDRIDTSLDNSSLGNNSQVEIIFALNPSLEGESTSFYLRNEIQRYLVTKADEEGSTLQIKFSRLAMGVPKGSEMEYVDSETLKYAYQLRGEL
jgi:recombination protein RecR